MSIPKLRYGHAAEERVFSLSELLGDELLKSVALVLVVQSLKNKNTKRTTQTWMIGSICGEGIEIFAT